MSFLSKRKNGTLKVRCNIYNSFINIKIEKAFVSASLKGSLTVEAALVFSIFLFALVSMTVPIRMVTVKRQVRAAMESVNEELCQIAYSYHTWKEPAADMQKEIDTEQMEEWLILAGGSLYLRTRVMGIVEKDAIESVSVSGTKILQDGEHIDLQVQYKIKVPFSFWKIASIPVTERSYKRAWIGKSGVKDETNQSENSEKNDSHIVYIGNTRSRFHWYSDCHYLSNEIETVLHSEIKQRKNKFGRYYQPCKICGDLSDTDGNVYIFSGGESFHGNQECPSLRSYIQEVEWQDVEMLGECSYCARRKYGTQP